MNQDIIEKLNNLKEEDLIWIISFFLVILSIISNQYEKNAILENNSELNNISKDIKIIILIIALFIYSYFVSTNIKEIEKIKQHNPYNKKNLIENQINLVASLLFLVGGIILLALELEKEAN